MTKKTIEMPMKYSRDADTLIKMRELSWPTGEGVATLSLDVMHKSVTVSVGVSITPEDAHRIRQALNACYSAAETLQKGDLD
jgi:hypothetical protein